MLSTSDTTSAVIATHFLAAGPRAQRVTWLLFFPALTVSHQGVPSAAKNSPPLKRVPTQGQQLLLCTVIKNWAQPNCLSICQLGAAGGYGEAVASVVVNHGLTDYCLPSKLKNLSGNVFLASGKQNKIPRRMVYI